MLRKDPEQYKALVAHDVAKSKDDIPPGFVLPTHETAFAKRDTFEEDYNMSWVDSDVESFGGSDSDMEDEDEDEMDGEGESESDDEM